MTESPVPKLDLAPKLNRPLQLWNPLDYLRLLYWILNFPQAIRYYIQSSFSRKKVLFQLGLISIILFCISAWVCKSFISNLRLSEIFIYTIIFCLPALNFSFKKNDKHKDIYSLEILTIGISNICIWGILLCYVYVLIFKDTSIFFGKNTLYFWVFLSTSLLLSEDIRYTFDSDFFSQKHFPIYERTFKEILLSLVGLIIYFFIFTGINDWAISSRANQINNFWLNPMEIVRLIIVYIAFFLFHSSIFRNMIVLRLDLIILSLILRKKIFFLALWHAGYLTFDNLAQKLKNHLHQDFEKGIENCNEVLKFSKQYMSVVNSITLFLSEIEKKDILIYIYFFIDGICIRGIESFMPRFLSKKYSFQDKRKRLILQAFLGYKNLRKNNLDLALSHFMNLRKENIKCADEVCVIIQYLDCFQKVNTVTEISILNINTVTNTSRLLHQNTWDAINIFNRVILDLQLFLHGVSRQVRSLALNRIIGELTQIEKLREKLPYPEQELVIKIAKTWKAAIEPLALDIGSAEITEPIRNPYVIGDPVIGKNFVGREDILRQLEEIWITDQQRQSIVLFGHRRMGKTSILRNATSHIGAQSKVIYINLQRLGEVTQGIGEVLIALSDEIQTATNIQSPSDDDLLKLPERTFERYLKKVLDQTDGEGVIIALDEFETLEDLIENQQISPNFLAYLRGLIQMSPKLAFAFAGLHTLEDMTADYFHPFFGSVIPIRVTFLSREATFQLLAAPNEDFPLDYEPAALQKIYELTCGQPYLVQLMGFQLVRRYNDYVFEQAKQRSNLLTIEDVEAIITEDFFKKGRYYFDGIWRQAKQGATGQTQIIQTLAHFPAGLTRTELLETLPFDAETLDLALKDLNKHDVVREHKAESRWQIAVELLRIWLENYAPKDGNA